MHAHAVHQVAVQAAHSVDDKLSVNVTLLGSVSLLQTADPSAKATSPSLHIHTQSTAVLNNRRRGDPLQGTIPVGRKVVLLCEGSNGFICLKAFSPVGNQFLHQMHTLLLTG